MNYKRIYQYRFRSIANTKKDLVWSELSKWMFQKHLNKPERILDPAGGFCEFINSVPAKEKWVIELDEELLHQHAQKNIKTLAGSNLEVALPKNYFNGIFISNFLEHLDSQQEVAIFLTKMYEAMAPGGRIVIIGPNFKCCYREYFDFADHKVILTELGAAEHLYGSGFEIIKIVPKFLPLSFRSRHSLPISRFLIRAYLKNPILWKIAGKQFLLVGEKSLSKE
jgi:SAM-dependent methyltransferase